jgi:IclR family pca regulon transcriptional regulator
MAQAVSPEPDPGPYQVRALARGLEVLTAFSRAARPLTMTELCRMTGIPMPTTFRLVSTLETAGYVERDPSGTYRPGVLVLALSHAALQGSNLVQLAERPLRSLADQTHQTVNLGVLQQDQVLYLVRLRNADLVTASIRVGSTLPAAYSSMGKLLLAMAGPVDVEHRRTEVTLPPGGGPNAVRTVDELEGQLVEIRSQGFAIQDEEVAKGLRSLAAPVVNAEGEVVAAINIAVNSQDFTVGEMVEEFKHPLRDAAVEVSRRLGAPPSVISLVNCADNDQREKER